MELCGIPSHQPSSLFKLRGRPRAGVSKTFGQKRRSCCQKKGGSQKKRGTTNGPWPKAGTRENLVLCSVRYIPDLRFVRKRYIRYTFFCHSPKSTFVVPARVSNVGKLLGGIGDFNPVYSINIKFGLIEITVLKLDCSRCFFNMYGKHNNDSIKCVNNATEGRSFEQLVG